MKVTFVLRDLQEEFYTGFGQSVRGLNNMTPAEKLANLMAKAVCPSFRGNVSMKVGNGSFRDRIELNQLLRGQHDVDFTLESRKGYKLASFDVKLTTLQAAA